jgi:hypothetical protein
MATMNDPIRCTHHSLSFYDVLCFTLHTLFRPLPNPFPLTHQPLSLLERHALYTFCLTHFLPIRKVAFPCLLECSHTFYLLLYTTVHFQQCSAPLSMSLAPSCMMLHTYCTLLCILYWDATLQILPHTFSRFHSPVLSI